MKNIINKISPKYMLIALIAIALNFSTMAASSPFESNNQNSSSSSGQPFDNSSSNSSMWGSEESTLFNSTPSNAGTRMNAPALPDEPGATCVPVPDGTIVLLGLVFIWGLGVLIRTKREKVKI